MHGAQTLVAQEDPAGNVSDLKLPAINVARRIQSHLSLQRAGRCYAAIALVPVGRRSQKPEFIVSPGRCGA